MSKIIPPLQWNKDKFLLIDQRKLPHIEEFIEVRNLEDTHEAIKIMVVRGAPLIGFTALYGLTLWVQQNEDKGLAEMKKAVDYLITARPTAVNLEYESRSLYSEAERYVTESGSLKGFSKLAEEYSNLQMEKIAEKNQKMAEAAEKELETIYGNKKLRLMTLCNTGYLACGPMGTALGVIAHLNGKGKVEHAYACETRPYLQGSRLTAYEMAKQGIPHSIVVEGAMSYLMRERLVDAIFIGADRIVSNGDTANKVGSSTLAITAKHYGVPFYVVAPLCSFDFGKETGSEIEIELRPEEEVLSCQGKRIAPDESTAWNPSFDITENTIITGIFSENGIAKPVNKETLAKMRNV
jgi:methylthioribose-1-phosphate isomerase